MRRPILRFAAAGRDSRAGTAGPVTSYEVTTAAGRNQDPARGGAWPLLVVVPAILARIVMERLRRAAHKARYRPEKHYMRGGRSAPAAAR